MNSEPFLPTAYIEKTQMVVGTLTAVITEEVDELQNDDGYGMRFNRIKREERKIFQIRIPVEEFIKNFEIVL